MEPPPSYNAIISVEWIDLVLPWIEVSDYPSLCRVDRRFYDRFAPLLWKDIITSFMTVHGKGNLVGRGLSFDQVQGFARSGAFRQSTRHLVKTVDYRGASETPTSQLPALHSLCEVFNDLSCIMLEGHSRTDGDSQHEYYSEPDPVADYAWTSQASRFREAIAQDVSEADLRDVCSTRLKLLSIPNAPHYLRNWYIMSGLLQNLVYLDISTNSHEVMQRPPYHSLHHSYLPSLRILKARNDPIRKSILPMLGQGLSAQLWSLDLTQTTKIGQGLTQDLYFLTDPQTGLRPSMRVVEEGRLAPATELSHLIHRQTTSCHSGLMTIEESALSTDFSSPDRYVIDAPAYIVSQGHHGEAPIWLDKTRDEGRGETREDSCDAIRDLIVGTTTTPPVETWLDHMVDAGLPGNERLCHLSFSGVKVRVEALALLFRMTRGIIRHLECGLPEYVLLGDWPSGLPRDAILFGFFGGAHLLRPAWSGNLRAVRIHHSIVTNTPTIQTRDFAGTAALWIAEASLRQGIDLAYPQRFVPDMNPRIYSLTLDNIPRRSSGPVVERLIQFLRLVAAQERAIQETRGRQTRVNSSELVSGLRHICLEFNPDPIHETDLSSMNSGVDQLQMAEGDFSFFQGEHAPMTTSAQPLARASALYDTASPGAAGIGLSATVTGAIAAGSNKNVGGQNGNLILETTQKWPLAGRNGEHITLAFFADRMPIKVWVGSGNPSPHPAVNQYMINLHNKQSWVAHEIARTDEMPRHIVPATPCHVVAGVPSGVLIFGSAWDAMMNPGRLAMPTTRDLGGMRDVLGELRRYRRRTRAAYEEYKAKGGVGEATHGHWTGNLQVIIDLAPPSWDL